MKLYTDPISIIVVMLITAAGTLAVETNTPKVSEFGDKYLSGSTQAYLSNKEGE